MVATGSPAQVTLVLAPNGDGPKLTATELPFHLAVLAVAGLVRDLRAGRERRWELELAQQWDRRLERLRLLVERE